MTIRPFRHASRTRPWPLWVIVFCTVGQPADLGAQNLVPNGDFENYTECPWAATQIGYAAPWMSAMPDAIEGPTPDYFNSCTGSSTIDVPSNFAGYMNDPTDHGYAGIIIYHADFPDFREYVEVELTQPLVAGECYALSFNTAFGIYSNTLTGDLGAHFSNSPVIQETWSVLPVVPQLDHLGGVIAAVGPFANWPSGSGVYLAQGGERYLTIGNFHDDATTIRIALDTTTATDWGYYYIDDVVLQPYTGNCGSVGLVENGTTTLSMALDPMAEALLVGSAFPGQTRIRVWDALGGLVLYTTFRGAASIGIGHLAAGGYFCTLVDERGGHAQLRFFKPE